MTERVCVVGLGYIGLPTAAVLAARGMTVHGVEVNPTVVESINSGKAHFAEPDLDMLVQAGTQTGRLTAHPEPAPADVFIICVPTPLTAEHSPDMSYVHQATDAICPHIREGNLVILESTSPPGTTDWIAGRVAERTGLRPPAVMFGHAPERVLPGRILHEVVDNDRIVGGIDDQSTERMARFYETFARGTIHRTNARTAETTKLVENAYRDVNIAFANELSRLTESLDVDVWDVIEMANRHPRVNILSPGPGVGGHCIPVDPWFLVSADPSNTSLIQQARHINLEKPEWVIGRVAQLADR
ncbi:MAG: nucleotide sugar dehydrogenase, partial [Gemmatimonadota bacterium]|nr:nucleotide sugar dehydrogenase [Gemmatimonadota bacterium]